jgi:predicted nucleotidyltransferase
MFSARPDRPVDPLTLAAIREVDKLAGELGLSYFVCGAMARDILLTHVHGIETGRATLDVDFGVAVGNWDIFENLKARLVETGKFEVVKKMAQRLMYKLAAGNQGYPRRPSSPSRPQRSLCSGFLMSIEQTR